MVTAHFPSQDPQGREQEGYRPAVVVGLPELLGRSRFNMVLVVPLTTDRQGVWSRSALYPRLTAGTAGLTVDSIVMLDQMRALDVGRMARYLGQLSSEQFEPIKQSLARVCAW